MHIDKDIIVIAVVAGSIFIAMFGVTTFLIAVSFTKRKRRLLLEREVREAYYQKGVLQAQLEMQEHTFNIISQDIHDNVGQILSLAKVNLNLLTLEQKENESFQRIKELVANAIAELRHLGTGYYAERLVEKGLVDAIRHQLNQLEKTGLFTTSFETQLENVSMEKNDLIFLYRMMQEAINNVIRHSAADRVTVSLLQKNDEVHIRITDNGKGFALTHKDFKPGIGLNSIRQRAEMIGAKADISSTPGTGTVIHLSFKQKAYDKNSVGR
ncbi:sensor histidine kinase [Sediminibacterium roseum]|uniref:Sensor histidine kinase n=1 Tax=Sediminibacterium roseum TaxID=1978412 RepID=A0ABW9ZSA8_9BACT|nr:sensor histidine kinase [Sediminibacterium roseum]NCI49189.1 sensor histidine kinase [Sediminibacterium roseum]